MIMAGEKLARKVVKFFRCQKQEKGSVRLLGIKVAFEYSYYLGCEENPEQVSRYIAQNYPSYNAHPKSGTALSVGYKVLDAPMSDSSQEEISEDVVELFKSQCQQKEEVKLLSIKVMLPKGTDYEMISKYICERYPSYKVCPKFQMDAPIIAIGYR